VGGQGRGAKRVAVVIDPDVWAEEVGRYEGNSAPRVAAERERGRLERDGVDRARLMRCRAHGSRGTRLRGRLKVYVPIGDLPPSERPYGFVFSPERGTDGLYLELLAFGQRHPRGDERTVYERAHKRVHGRYPDEE
jgi:hypothetical protein